MATWDLFDEGLASGPVGYKEGSGLWELGVLWPCHPRTLHLGHPYFNTLAVSLSLQTEAWSCSVWVGCGSVWPWVPPGCISGCSPHCLRRHRGCWGISAVWGPVSGCWSLKGALCPVTMVQCGGLCPSESDFVSLNI